MSPKSERQSAILDVVGRRAVATQSELRDRLKERGIEADQATLSRDVKELGLIKVSDDGEHYRYSTVEAAAPSSQHPKASAILARLVRKVEASGNLLVVKTEPGDASPLGLAFDRLGWPEIAGTVAGDDTLLVVVKEGVPPRKVAKKILDLKHPKKDSA